jgi:hypothetical protein
MISGSTPTSRGRDDHQIGAHVRVPDGSLVEQVLDSLDVRRRQGGCRNTGARRSRRRAGSCRAPGTNASTARAASTKSRGRRAGEDQLQHLSLGFRELPPVSGGDVTRLPVTTDRRFRDLIRPCASTQRHVSHQILSSATERPGGRGARRAELRTSSRCLGSRKSAKRAPIRSSSGGRTPGDAGAHVPRDRRSTPR